MVLNLPLNMLLLRHFPVQALCFWPGGKNGGPRQFHFFCSTPIQTLRCFYVVFFFFFIFHRCFHPILLYKPSSPAHMDTFWAAPVWISLEGHCKCTVMIVVEGDWGGGAAAPLSLISHSGLEDWDPLPKDFRWTPSICAVAAGAACSRCRQRSCIQRVSCGAFQRQLSAVCAQLICDGSCHIQLQKAWSREPERPRGSGLFFFF